MAHTDEIRRSLICRLSGLEQKWPTSGQIDARDPQRTSRGEQRSALNTKRTSPNARPVAHHISPLSPRMIHAPNKAHPGMSMVTTPRRAPALIELRTLSGEVHRRACHNRQEGDEASGRSEERKDAINVGTGTSVDHRVHDVAPVGLPEAAAGELAWRPVQAVPSFRVTIRLTSSFRR